MEEDDKRKRGLLSENVKKMQDELVVYAHMTLHRAVRIQEHEEWLREHELANARLERNLERLAELILGGHTTNGNLQP
jgi:hypothetical protein